MAAGARGLPPPPPGCPESSGDANKWGITHAMQQLKEQRR